LFGLLIIGEVTTDFGDDVTAVGLIVFEHAYFSNI
jgi:hypothetical protein